MIKDIKKSKKGFTIIELVIASGIFLVLVAIAVGGFIGVWRTQRIAAGMMSVNDNTSVTLEQMTRELRTGYNFCTESAQLTDPAYQAQCNSLQRGSTEIQFVNANSEVVRYRLSNERIERGVRPSVCDASTCPRGVFNSCFCFEPITASNVSVQNFRILLSGQNPPAGDNLVPKITLVLGVTASTSLAEARRLNIVNNIQTTVVSRLAE